MTAADVLVAELLAAWDEYERATVEAQALVDAAEAKVRAVQDRFGAQLPVEEDDGTVRMVFAGEPVVAQEREVRCGAPTKRGTPCRNVTLDSFHGDVPTWDRNLAQGGGPFADWSDGWNRDLHQKRYEAAEAEGFRCHVHRRPRLTVVTGMSA